MDSTQEITDLTICRALFAAGVFVCFLNQFLHFSHFLGRFSGLVSHGYLGVDGFFMLSGLALMHVHREFDVVGMDGPVPEFSWPKWSGVWRFYVLRVGRIYPVHLVTLLVVVALVWAGLGPFMQPLGHARFSLGAGLRNMVLVQGWGGEAFGSWNVPAWALSDLWAGYLLFPVLAMLLNYFGRNVALQIALVVFPVLGVIYYYAGGTLDLRSGAGLLRFFPEFIAGMAMYRVAVVVADYNGVRGFFLWVGVGLTLVGVALSCDIAAVPGLWALIFACYLQHGAEMKPFFGRARVLLFLGRLSYCFYMSFAIAGMLVYALFVHLGWRILGHGLLFALCVTLITFGLAVLLRGVVEGPCRRWVTLCLHRVTPVADDSVVQTSHSLF